MNTDSLNEKVIWKIISKYFEDNPQWMVSHHVDSYNDFFQSGILQIFKDKNEISINTVYDKKTGEHKHQCKLFFGGKEGNRIYFGKPVIYDDKNPHYMYPNEARLRNMTYSMTIHYDIEVEHIDILDDGEAPYIVDSLVELEKGRFGGSSGIEMEGGEPIEWKYSDKQEMPGKDELYSINEQDGGAPKEKKDGKNVRKKRVKSTEVEMTPSQSKEMNERIKRSMMQSDGLHSTNIQKRTYFLEKIYLGKFPIMVQSHFCILNGLPPEMRFHLGECKNDYGGYFIIDGKEKVVIPQEKFGDNIMYIRKSKNEEFLYSAEIRSVSENVSKPIRTLSIRLVAPQKKYSFENIVVFIPNVRSPVPLFILFRALGILSDKAIIQMCLLDLDKYENWIDDFIPSIHDAGGIMTQKTALVYIATLTKYSTVSYVLQVLSDYFLPHVGELNFIQKAYYLGYMVFRLLSVYKGVESPTDRDNYKHKRIELVGSLINDLFREYYTIQQREIHLAFEKKLYYNRDMYEHNLYELIQNNYRDVVQERHVEIGFRKAFKGDWGSVSHTKRVGVVQDMNRLSYNSTISHLRKTNLPLDSGVKLVEPRVLHCSQWGFIDPIDTPDGANIGIHKTLSITSLVSRGISREPMIKWMRENIHLKWIEECSPISQLLNMTKVFINGFWAGMVENPTEQMEKMMFYRRNALIPIYMSITFDRKQNIIYLYNDAGRVCRPIFYKDVDKMFSIENKPIVEHIRKDEFTWNDLISGFNKKRVAYDPTQIYSLEELYETTATEAATKNPLQLERFHKNKAIIDYIDPSESENSFIAMNFEDIQYQSSIFNSTNKDLMKIDGTEKDKHEKDKNKKDRHTHLEIHESLIFGVMCNQIIFPEHNPPTRNAFSCGQTRQAVSMYHTNYTMRMDKTAVVLHYGQIPFVKSRFMEYINNEENPYGINAIVAIMCYTGYNVEDAILINEGSLKRGIFNNTYYTMYETREESTKTASGKVNKRFMNIEKNPNVIGTKTGYFYHLLDDHGLIRENTAVNDKTVLIGMATEETGGIKYRDTSKTPKKGQLGMVDKSFMTEGQEGERIAKVRLREVRIPNLGDKFAGRAGQKGTIGLVIPEQDMPFNREGIRPDLIMNPHALPSRMTIGQLVEAIFGKAGAMYGGFHDCTAFSNKSTKIGVVGEHLSKVGFHSSGNEIFYNGMTGDQIETEIFVGPTYYMRLKHMVKDKINFRALGPRTALTRQPVSGRANDGGLRIGEMERDVLISHGISEFLRDSMMERGDKFHMAICNKTGSLAIYNPSKDLFISPQMDGPVSYTVAMTSNGENENSPKESNNKNGVNMTIQNITKYGRDFSVVAVPYSLKLLVQELQTMNIQMRIITEDNIDQIDHVSFSNNINLLNNLESSIGQKDATILQRIRVIRDTIMKLNENKRKHMNILDNTQNLFDDNIEDDLFNDFENQTINSDVNTNSSVFSVPMAPRGNTPTFENESLSSNDSYTPVSIPLQMQGQSIQGQPVQGQSIQGQSIQGQSIQGQPMQGQLMQRQTMQGQTIQGQSMQGQSIQGQTIKGGNKKISWKPGDKVYYTKEKNFDKTKRVWKIKKIGRLFYTIETDDTSGMDFKDHIQVVAPMDIQSIYDMPEMNSSFPIIEQNTIPFNNMSHGFQQPPSTIQINPSFKIINGPDNSTGTEPTKTIDMFDSCSPYQNNSFITPNNNEEIMMSPQTNGLNIIQTPQQPIIATDGDMFSGSSKNIVIKKLG